MEPLRDLDPEHYHLPQEVRARLMSPALVVHLDVVRRNVREVLSLAGSDAGRWRPHVKTTKLPEVFVEVARAGIRNFKCATPREAEVLCRTLTAEGASGADVLIAYPLLGPGLLRAGQVARAHPEVRLSVLCEDPARVADVPEELGIFVDVNPGMNRTGIPAVERGLIAAVAEAAGRRGRFGGLHFYDGHLHDDDLGERTRRAHRGYDLLLETREHVRSRGVEVPELVTSGTPSFPCSLSHEGFASLDGTVHRMSPGTVVFHDLRSAEENPNLDLRPAAVLFTRIVSRPARGIVTCDAGSKSIAAEAGDPCALVIGRPDLVALTPSEEHLPLRVTAGPTPELGTELFLVPRHVCPTTNLAEEVLLVDGGEVLGPAPVRARAHDLLLPLV